jgi:5-formyltetrahydrofolate cyclo-ligase
MSLSKQLRKSIIRERQALTALEIRTLSSQIHKQIDSSPLFLKSNRLAFYLPHQGEVDTIPLLQKALLMKKQCFLPVLHPIKHNRLLFVEYFHGDKLNKNNYGILEPHLTNREIVASWSLDIIFLPLVAFDEAGHRIGMGGGYYDRTLAFKKKKRQRSKPTLVGLAYEFQKNSQVPVANWDVSLEAAVTEKKIYSFHR